MEEPVKIRDVKPGTTVTIKEGPAKGRKIRIVAKGSDRVAVTGQGQDQVVRGDLEVE